LLDQFAAEVQTPLESTIQETVAACAGMAAAMADSMKMIARLRAQALDDGPGGM
jgi:hypothetical protein